MTDSLLLESGNGLHLSLNVVIGGFEGLEELLALGNDVLVLDEPSVVLKVDFGLGFAKLRIVQSRLARALSERGDGGDRFCGAATVSAPFERSGGTAYPCGDPISS